MANLSKQKPATRQLKGAPLPVLTGIGTKAYIYESPQKADHACLHLDLDTIEIYSDNVEQQLQQVKTSLGVTWKWVEYATLI